LPRSSLSHFRQRRATSKPIGSKRVEDRSCVNARLSE
jgi:hypothetical protein